MALPLMTTGILDDALIRGYFSDILRQGGYGTWKTESAAFLVRDKTGDFRCVAWPYDGRPYRQEFVGAIPEGTFAIIHTNPSDSSPEVSVGDAGTAMRLSLPVFVVAPRDINMVSGTGALASVVRNRKWASKSVVPSKQCVVATRQASN